jgi:hypothetical protein
VTDNELLAEIVAIESLSDPERLRELDLTVLD